MSGGAARSRLELSHAPTSTSIHLPASASDRFLVWTLRPGRLPTPLPALNSINNAAGSRLGALDPCQFVSRAASLPFFFLSSNVSFSWPIALPFSSRSGQPGSGISVSLCFSYVWLVALPWVVGRATVSLRRRQSIGQCFSRSSSMLLFVLCSWTSLKLRSAISDDSQFFGCQGDSRVALFFLVVRCTRNVSAWKSINGLEIVLIYLLETISERITSCSKAVFPRRNGKRINRDSPHVWSELSGESLTRTSG